MELASARVAERRILSVVVAFAALLASLAFAAPARAQVVPSVLEEFRLVTEDAGAATFILRFSPSEPRVATVDRNPTRPELVAATTVKSGRVANRHTYRGFVRVLQFFSEDSSLVVRFDTAGPATITSERIGNNAI